MISPRGKNPILLPSKAYHLPTHLLLPATNSMTSKLMASPTLVTPSGHPKPHLAVKSKLSAVSASAGGNAATPATTAPQHRRREFLSLAAVILSPAVISPARAASDEEYVKETEEVISKVRNTITMDRNDPNVATAVTELRETSNSWVAKYRKEKALLGRLSFRDMYSALNAVSGHYISFGPTTPIPAKRRVRILEEMDSVEKALQRGR